MIIGSMYENIDVRIWQYLAEIKNQKLSFDIFTVM